MSKRKHFPVLSPTQKDNVGTGLQRDLAISQFNGQQQPPVPQDQGFDVQQAADSLAQMIGARVVGARKKTLPQ